MMQGGATLQFSSIPLNMLGSKTKADYLVTGQWGEKAHKDGGLLVALGHGHRLGFLEDRVGIHVKFASLEL